MGIDVVLRVIRTLTLVPTVAVVVTMVATAAILGAPATCAGCDEPIILRR